MKFYPLTETRIVFKNTIRLFSVSLLFLLSVTTTAQLKEADPATTGFSSERLAKIDSLFNDYTENDHRIAGVVGLVARHGKIIYYNASGYNDMDAGKKLKRDDMFRIASQTKAITAVAVMMLYEEGKFLLDDAVSKYIPEFKDMQVLDQFNKEDTSYTTVPAKSAITIRQLLTHTSGISYPMIGSAEATAIYAKLDVPVGFEMRNITLEEGMKRVAKAPLMHQPGEKYSYGLSIDLLGYLIEKVSGMSFRDFLQTRLFTPLGMQDTYFYVPEEKWSRVSKTYVADKNGNKVEFISSDPAGGTEYPFVKNGTYFSGGAGLISTAKDYTIFLHMLADGGVYNGQRILSPSTVRLMTINQVDREKIDRGTKDDMGLSFNIATAEGGATRFPWSVGTYDWGGFWGSSFWVDPETGIVAQIWTQDRGAHYKDLAKRFIVMVYSALVNP